MGLLIKQLRIQCGVASNCAPETELLPDPLRSTAAHLACHLRVTKQIEYLRRQGAWLARWNQEAVPAVLDDVAAAWHRRRDDRQAGECSLEQRAGHAFAIFGREHEHVGEAEQGWHVRSLP